MFLFFSFLSMYNPNKAAYSNISCIIMSCYHIHVVHMWLLWFSNVMSKMQNDFIQKDIEWSLCVELFVFFICVNFQAHFMYIYNVNTQPAHTTTYKRNQTILRDSTFIIYLLLSFTLTTSSWVFAHNKFNDIQAHFTQFSHMIHWKRLIVGFHDGLA